MFGITWGTQHGKFYLYTYIRSRSRVSHFRNSLWAEGRKGRDRSPARLRRQNFPSFMWNEREPVSRWTSIVGRSVGPRVNEVWIWATELTLLYSKFFPTMVQGPQFWNCKPPWKCPHRHPDPIWPHDHTPSESLGSNLCLVAKRNSGGIVPSRGPKRGS